MSFMKDKIRTANDLGHALKLFRQTEKLKAIDIAEHSGKSRDVLNRLEKGQDITVSSLFGILRAMGLCLSIESVGLPTLEEMQARFADENDDPA
jgi:transcriptional regulator with XRE-family HTH domain